MSTTVAVRPEGAIQADRYEEEQLLQTIRETVCKGATPAQFRMFIEICRSTGLNPFLREIWFVPGVGVMAGRDGYLRVANEHPMFDGMETLVERDAKNVPVKATCRVWRKDRGHPITCEAYYSEYRKESGVWKQYPSAMISKVAEVLALKRSFSINGVVTEEEIGNPAQEKADARAAQSSLAEAKVKALQAGTPRAQVERIGAPEPPSDDPLEAGPEDLPPILGGPDPAPQTELEEKLDASLERADPDKFKALKAFRELKEEMCAAIGSDALYYTVLGREGYEKSNQIPPAETRRVYRALANAFVQWRADQEAQ